MAMWNKNKYWHGGHTIIRALDHSSEKFHNYTYIKERKMCYYFLTALFKMKRLRGLN